MLSRYTRQVYQCSLLSTRSRSRSNVSGALQSSNGITLNCHKPLFTLNAVLSLSAISTCQYLLCRSNVDNHFVPASVSSVSSILGNGYLSFLVTSINFLQSTQNLVPPSFFLTKSTGELHGPDDGSGFIGLASPVSISYLTMSVFSCFFMFVAKAQHTALAAFWHHFSKLPNLLSISLRFCQNLFDPSTTLIHFNRRG